MGLFQFKSPLISICSFNTIIDSPSYFILHMFSLWIWSNCLWNIRHCVLTEQLWTKDLLLMCSVILQQIHLTDPDQTQWLSFIAVVIVDNPVLSIHVFLNLHHLVMIMLGKGLFLLQQSKRLLTLQIKMLLLFFPFFIIINSFQETS